MPDDRTEPQNDSLTEDSARRTLLMVIHQGMAAEFIQRCVWGDDFYTSNPDGTVIILDASLLAGSSDA